MQVARVFTDEPLLEIVRFIVDGLERGESAVRVRVLDPDHGRGLYAGEQVEIDGCRHRHRPLRVWVELAERLHLRLATPRQTGGVYVELCFEPLDEDARWEGEGGLHGDPTEKYGSESGYARISKLEDPSLLLDMGDALERVRMPDAPRILDLGVNRGDEFALLLALRPEWTGRARFVGVDHSSSALAVARERFSGGNFEFIEADVNEIAARELGQFDLVMSLGTLHSPGVDDRSVLRAIVKRWLAPGGGVILGVPNCRYVDGEQLFGARTKNFRQPELGLLIKTVAHWKKYLQQHRRKVYVTGTHHVLVTGAAETGS
jgi:ubiquinone/menaquinone biosynthesis C-methylase UbiE